MPRWRRRRIQRRRRAHRKLEEKLAARQYIRLDTFHEDGTVDRQRWKVPRVQLPPGTKVWTQEEIDKKGAPPGSFVMEISFNAMFHKCEMCNHVWQPPVEHTKDECNLMVTRQVLES